MRSSGDSSPRPARTPSARGSPRASATGSAASPRVFGRVLPLLLGRRRGGRQGVGDVGRGGRRERGPSVAGGRRGAPRSRANSRTSSLPEAVPASMARVPPAATSSPGSMSCSSVCAARSMRRSGPMPRTRWLRASCSRRLKLPPRTCPSKRAMSRIHRSSPAGMYCDQVSGTGSRARVASIGGVLDRPVDVRVGEEVEVDAGGGEADPDVVEGAAEGQLRGGAEGVDHRVGEAVDAGDRGDRSGRRR